MYNYRIRQPIFKAVQYTGKNWKEINSVLKLKLRKALPNLESNDWVVKSSMGIVETYSDKSFKLKFEEV
jgi:hypothetical protein